MLANLTDEQRQPAGELATQSVRIYADMLGKELAAARRAAEAAEPADDGAARGALSGSPHLAMMPRRQR